MGHSDHEPGTVPDCPDCLEISYEPGWYRLLLTDHPTRREPVVIPEAERIELVLPGADLPDIVVPELEDVRSEDDDR